MKILLTIWTDLTQHSSEAVSPILYSLLFFITLVLAMIVLIHLLRLKKLYYASLKKNTLERFNSILMASLTRIEENHTRLTAFSAEKMIAVHNLQNSFSNVQKQYILDEIINYFRNVKGNYKELLIALYHHLQLQELSQKKIRSKNKSRIVTGIRELSNMDIYIPWNDIIRLMQKNDPFIREELLYTLGKQSPEKLLYFLEHRHHYLTTWDEINIHAAYKRLDRNKLPKFSKWFFSFNQKLALFCIKMTGEFQQQSSFDEIHTIFQKTRNPLKIMAGLQVVEKMGASELSNVILHTLYKWIENEEIVYQILLTVEKLMDSRELSGIINKLSGYPSFRINQLIQHITETNRNDNEIAQKKIIKMIKQAS